MVKDEDTRDLGVNMTQFLLHHIEEIILSDLDNFDQTARDIIRKREMAKLW